MSRRSRNSRAWRYVWGGIRRDADARALVLAPESEEWSYGRLEVRTPSARFHFVVMWQNVFFLCSKQFPCLRLNVPNQHCNVADLGFRHFFFCLLAPKFSDSDSETDFSAVMVPPVPSAVPVTGESYCGCDSQAETSYNPRLRGFHQVKDCHCGEDDQGRCCCISRV